MLCNSECYFMMVRCASHTDNKYIHTYICLSVCMSVFEKWCHCNDTASWLDTDNSWSIADNWCSLRNLPYTVIFVTSFGGSSKRCLKTDVDRYFSPYFCGCCFEVESYFKKISPVCNYVLLGNLILAKRTSLLLFSSFLKY